MTHWYDDGQLRFAVGIENTFIPQTRVGHRALDEYELTQHYHYWSDDLALVREAGATMIRYGIPWWRVNPAPGVFDWSWLDRVVARMVELGIEPIVDLMHYGTPLWMENEFLNADYPDRVAEYSAAVAERYRGAMSIYTPLNEPLLHALHCGQYAMWPPYLRGHDGFVKLLAPLLRGFVKSQHAIAEVTGGKASFVHVEASFRYSGDLDAHREEATLLQHRQFLFEDLLVGNVTAEHPLVPYLQRFGFGDAELAWARDNRAPPDVMGVNYYPAVSTERFEAGRVRSGSWAEPRPRDNQWTAGLEDVLRRFAARYPGPIFLSETCLPGSVEDRVRWMDASVATVKQLRAEGMNLIGYTWWSVIDMMEWSYREGLNPPEAYLLGMGLWDLVPDATGVLRRVKTAAADRFLWHCQGGVDGGGVMHLSSVQRGQAEILIAEPIDDGILGIGDQQGRAVGRHNQVIKRIAVKLGIGDHGRQHIAADGADIGHRIAAERGELSTGQGLERMEGVANNGLVTAFFIHFQALSS